MNSAEAVACYKEIMMLSESMGSNSFNMVSTKKENSKPGDYQIRITMSGDDETKQQVANIAKERKVAMKEENNEVVIYEP
jgi:phosphoribosyl-ATP pyrophosphohydrolase